MNRPRNRQPRADGGRGRGDGQRARPSRQYPSNVPDVTQVVSGTKVSIVLKQDQGTGREVQGTVQDVLTSGNHPRGIKVRMTDGSVGRVQRMGSMTPETAQAESAIDRSTRNDYTTLPPPQSLGSFITSKQKTSRQGRAAAPASTTTIGARCPICNDFEGDEIAVSRHVEEHLD